MEQNTDFDFRRLSSETADLLTKQSHDTIDNIFSFVCLANFIKFYLITDQFGGRIQQSVGLVHVCVCVCVCVCLTGFPNFTQFLTKKGTFSTNDFEPDLHRVLQDKPPWQISVSSVISFESCLDTQTHI